MQIARLQVTAGSQFDAEAGCRPRFSLAVRPWQQDFDLELHGDAGSQRLVRGPRGQAPMKGLVVDCLEGKVARQGVKVLGMS